MANGHIESFLLLAILSVTYSVAAGRVERLRLAVSSGKVPNMLGVWTFAGVVALPVPLVIALVAIAYSADWSARRVVARKQPGRYVYSAVTAAAACVASGEVLHAIGGLAGTAAAIAAFAILNVGSIAAAITASGQYDVLKMLRSPRAHLVELATQCLGAALGAGVQWHQPLVVLALPILLLTHYSAVRDAVRISRTFDETTGLWREGIWRVQAAEVLNRGKYYAVIAICPVDAGRERLIGAALQDCLRAKDLRGRYGEKEVVAATLVGTASAALAVTARIRKRLDDLSVDCTVGCASAADLDVDELLVQAVSDVMARRAVAGLGVLDRW